MPAIDKVHQIVKSALMKDGWIITMDPLVLKYGERNLFVDLGAEKLIEATKDNIKIAVEIKSFLGPSPISEVQHALGQYLMYKAVIEATKMERILILAMSNEFYTTFFTEPLGKLLLDRYSPNLVLINFTTEEIFQWLPKII